MLNFATGLIVRMNRDNVITTNQYNVEEISNSYEDFFYTFDVVTNEDVAKPNDAEYEVMKN